MMYASDTALQEFGLTAKGDLYALNCYVPRPRTEYAKSSLHYRGSVLWNKIPSEIRQRPTLKVFKTSLNGKDYF